MNYKNLRLRVLIMKNVTRLSAENIYQSTKMSWFSITYTKKAIDPGTWEVKVKSWQASIKSNLGQMPGEQKSAHHWYSHIFSILPVTALVAPLAPLLTINYRNYPELKKSWLFPRKPVDNVALNGQCLIQGVS